MEHFRSEVRFATVSGVGGDVGEKTGIVDMDELVRDAALPGEVTLRDVGFTKRPTGLSSTREDELDVECGNGRCEMDWYCAIRDFR